MPRSSDAAVGCKPAVTAERNDSVAHALSIDGDIGSGDRILDFSVYADLKPADNLAVPKIRIGGCACSIRQRSSSKASSIQGAIRCAKKSEANPTTNAAKG
jgi:hypothetical protein